MLLAGSKAVFADERKKMKSKNYIQLIRHATLVFQIEGKRILIDPMLSEKEQLDPVKNCGNEKRIPMVPLPFERSSISELLADIDAVIVTHTHRDHWDIEAQHLIPKSKPIFCQPSDEEKIRAQNFQDVRAIPQEILWEGLHIHRTSGQHGTGEIGRQMGEVSGFVISTNNTRIYIAGDTIWCKDVEGAIKTFHPDYIVLNAGGAQFLTGGPITMTPDDVIAVSNSTPSKLIAVHMDSVNHCFVTRQDLANSIRGKNINIHIPVDGEIISIR